LLAPALGALALFNVLFVLKGRTGYIAALTVIVAALLWETRAHWRWQAVLIPALGLAVLASVSLSPQIRSRVELAAAETLAFRPGNIEPSSTGARLNFWYRSAQAIAERPLTGFGAGSWGAQYKRLDAGADPWYKGSGGNPHQEFLLWGVLLGVGGMALLLALLVTLWRDAGRLPQPQARAMKTVILMLATTGMFNSVLYDGEIGDYFCLMLGLLLALGRSQVQPATAMDQGAAA
jgi:O-antigen ligase